jgi:spermidine/putrescine-binding protein
MEDQRELTRRELLIGAGAIAAAESLVRPGPASAALAGPLHVFTSAVAGRDKDMREAQKDLGIDIKVTFNVSHVETFAKMNAGVLATQQDVLLIQQQFVRPLAKQGWLQPIDLGQLKNHRLMFAEFQNPSWAQWEGKVYGLPTLWGYDSIVYNAKRMPDGGESWGRLWDDRYKGRVALRDAALDSFQIVALYLGYDPNKLTRKELEDCKRFLISKKPYFRQLWSTLAEAVNLLRSEEVWALFGWLPMSTALKKDGMDIRYGLPKEKAIAWFSCYMISKDTKVLPACNAFLDWVIGEKFATSMAKDQGYRMSTTAHLKNLSPETVKEMQLDDIPGLVRNLFVQDLPDNLNEWLQAWSEFKSA